MDCIANLRIGAQNAAWTFGNRFPLANKIEFMATSDFLIWPKAAQTQRSTRILGSKENRFFGATSLAN